MKNYLLALIFFLTHIALFSYTDSFEIRSVSVYGAKKTKTSYIVYLSGIKKGDTVSEERLEKIIEKAEIDLWNTNNFSELKIDYTIENNLVDVAITVKDRWSLFPYIVPFYNNKTGLSVSAGLVDANFLGYHKIIISSVSLSEENINLFLKYIDKSFFNTGSILNTEIEYGETEEYTDEDTSFRFERIRFETEYLYPVSGNFYAGVYLENDYSYGNYLGPDPVITSAPSFYIDTVRNQKYFKEGHSFRLRPGIMNKDTSGVNFYLFTEETLFFNFSEQNTPLSSYFAIRSSFIHSPEKAFYLDSAGDIRGINDGEQSGNTGYLLNTEYRQFVAALKKPFPLNIYIPFYIDTGQLWNNDEDFVLSVSTRTCGTGIIFYPEKINLLIRLDIGINIGKYTEEEKDFSYFSVKFGSDMF